MSSNLNSLKEGYIGNYIGDYYRDIKGNTSSLDNGSNRGGTLQGVRGACRFFGGWRLVFGGSGQKEPEECIGAMKEVCGLLANIKE